MYLHTHIYINIYTHTYVYQTEIWTPSPRQRSSQRDAGSWWNVAPCSLFLYIYIYLHIYTHIYQTESWTLRSHQRSSRRDVGSWWNVAQCSLFLYIYTSTYIYTYVPDGVLEAKISPTINSKGCRELVKRRAMLTFSGAACPATPYSSGSRFYAHVLQKSGTS